MKTTPSDALPSCEQTLRELRERLRKLSLSGIDLLKVEEEIRMNLDSIGRELMSEVLAEADIDDPEVRINGILHGRVGRHRAKIHTTFGIVEVDRTTYRIDRKTPTVAPFDKILGIVESFYTPKCAKVLCLLPAFLVREDVESVVREFGGLSVSSATMHRLPLAIMARYEERRDLIERTVRERSVVPADASMVQIGLDGVMVPQDGEHCRPRGRKPKDEPAPARWQSKYGEVTPPGPAANDGHRDRAWHEASVCTLAFFDLDGKHIQTTYLGRMPEEKKATLAAMLENEVQHIFALRPDLQPIFASDGAPAQWTILDNVCSRLPENAQGIACKLIDVFHVSEHLQEAADAIDGEASPEAKVRRAGWTETLKVYDNGAERVLQALRHQRRSTKSKKVFAKIEQVIGYIARNKHRMNYKDALENKMPIATGPTEAAAKSLVGVRMKRSGARYSQQGGQMILTLLAAQKSGRFDNLFDTIAETYAAPVRRGA